jgi:hypothetical protein
MAVHSCNHCQNVILKPIGNKATGKREILSKENTFVIFEFSKDEIRTGAQAGCAFFQLCIKKLDVFRKLAFCSVPRRCWMSHTGPLQSVSISHVGDMR